jgi:hypothetical protein
MLLTADIYASTLTVIHEYIQVIVNTYDFYLKGYAQSSFSITDKEFIDLLRLLSKSNFMNGFDLSEFIDLPKMIQAAENLYGKYQWGQYDLIMLPYSFPFGGMENPRLTFVNPTV